MDGGGRGPKQGHHSLGRPYAGFGGASRMADAFGSRSTHSIGLLANLAVSAQCGPTMPFPVHMSMTAVMNGAGGWYQPTYTPKGAVDP